MKKYPRLYSLSTLGIRQHQEFDYQLHGFRTDFVGDSGCGKSMIADLIQLVFVGSEVFQSGTDSLEKREVEGMVLRTSGSRGTDMAYVLINIEVKAGQFLVLGAYLESSSPHSKSFVIQAGYDEHDLKLLDRPVSVSDICINDQIPTLEWLKQSLEERGLIYHGMSQRKKFHAFLYKYQLLSIDLSQSPQVLRDYALIIQSFSRGKSLDISDSASIKRFLFGNEKAKEITGKYRKAVEELQLTLKEHAQNQQDIELVTKKYQALKVLEELKDQMDMLRLDFWTKRCAFAVYRANEEYQSFRESSMEYVDTVVTLKALNLMLLDELEQVDLTTTTLNREVEAAKIHYHHSFSMEQQVSPFRNLRDKFGLDIDLMNVYSSYQQQKYIYELWSIIGREVIKHSFEKFLDCYHQHDGLSLILEAVQMDISQKEFLIGQKRQLLAFTELTNEGSLGNWAIQHYRSYSLEVESLLMFFKDLPVLAPRSEQDRYVANPEALFQIADRIVQEENGFWINMGEISQFIPYVRKRLFAVEDNEELKNLLATITKDLKQEVFKLNQELTELGSFKSFILDQPRFPEFMKIYTIGDSALEFEEVPALNIDRVLFEAGLVLLDQADEIHEKYLEAESQWKKSEDSIRAYDKLVGTIKTTLHQLTGYLDDVKTKNTLEILNSTFFDLVQSDLEETLKALKLEFRQAPVKSDWIYSLSLSSQQKIKMQDIERQMADWQQCVKEKEEVFSQTAMVLENLPDDTTCSTGLLEYPQEEETSCRVAEGLYEQKFSELVVDFAAGEGYRFERIKSYKELCTVVLPEAFLGEHMENEGAIEVIGEYLVQINDKNKNLNNRKLLKIREILDEVLDEVGKREDTIRQIHHFLDNGSREITGGHRVSLRASASTSYPKTWINGYIEKLTEENTLFATGQTLAELLNNSMSLEEKMISAFRTFGGHRAVKASVEDLLNPNSYFELTFKMESHASGKTNIGSTGQVYAAIALLCIARLSLVNKSSFHKDPPPGIRFMPIDEAEGLGSNFDLLYDIARDFDYQILTMGIKPLGKFREGEQYIYMLSNNKEVPEDVNYTPFAVFCEADQF
ncbi:ABC-type oligopeptide transport system ATPase subunit [Pedobacter africanus]|uniref:hypothetical protein n=1 Tax=Pedobacter africanus TaxID=151894 RepID=UPI0033926ED0